MSVEYQPSGKFTALGLFLMPVLGILGALFGSYVYFLFNKHLCTLVFLFALGLGGLAGGGVGLGVYWGKVRNPALAGTIGLLCGLFAFAMTFYWGYRDLNVIVETMMLEDYDTHISAEEADRLVELILLEETGSQGIWGYVLLSAGGSQLALIDSSGVDVLPFETPAWLDHILSIVELICATGASCLVAAAIASLRFCERDSRWYRTKTVIESSVNSAAEITKALLVGQYTASLAFIELPKDNRVFAVETEGCPACKDGVMKIAFRSGMKRKELHTLKLTPRQFGELEWLAEQAKKKVKALKTKS